MADETGRASSIQATSDTPVRRWQINGELVSGVWFAFALLVCAAAVLGFWQQPTFDDLLLSKQVHQLNDLVKFVSSGYLGWSGRVLAWIWLGLFFHLPIESYGMISLFLGAVFLLLGPLLILTLSLNNYARLSLIKARLGRDFALLTGTVCLVSAMGLMAGCFKVIPESVYWATGGLNYSFSFLIALLWFLGFRLMLYEHWQPRSPVLKIVWLFFSFLIGTAHEQISASLLLLAAWDIGKAQRTPSKGKHNTVAKLAWWAIALFATGTLVLLCAPGNFVRATHLPHGGMVANLLASALANLFRMELLAAYKALFAIIAGLIAGAAMSLAFGRTIYKAYRPKDLFSSAAESSVAAACAVAPLSLVPYFASARTYFIPLVFAFAAAFFLAVAVVRPFSIQLRKARAPVQACGSAAIVVAFLVSSGDLVFQISKAIPFHREMAARYQYLRANTGKSDLTVVVPPLRHRPPRFLKYWELSQNPNSDLNMVTASYFGVGAVAISKHSQP